MRAKKQDGQKDPQELKAGQLSDYFRERKADCQVSYRRDIDFGWRFYFVKENRNARIVDINRDVLPDWSAKQIISILEKAKWEQVLATNPGTIPCFRSAGIEFRRWPI